MIESIKRLVMALVFFYLGGLVCGTAIGISLGAPGMEAVKMAAEWPYFAYVVTAMQYGATPL